MPFEVNDTTSELLVTRPVDREEREMYRMQIVCKVETGETINKLFLPMHVNIYDENDNPPYVNGTDTEDVVVEFNRMKVSTPFCLFLNTFSILSNKSADR